jgi:hypothetical protein
MLGIIKGCPIRLSNTFGCPFYKELHQGIGTTISYNTHHLYENDGSQVVDLNS